MCILCSSNDNICSRTLINDCYGWKTGGGKYVSKKWSQFPFPSTLKIPHLPSQPNFGKEWLTDSPLSHPRLLLTPTWLPSLHNSLKITKSSGNVCPHLLSRHWGSQIFDYVPIFETASSFTLLDTLSHCLFLATFFFYCSCAQAESLILVFLKDWPDTLLFVLYTLSLTGIILLLAIKISMNSWLISLYLTPFSEFQPCVSNHSLDISTWLAHTFKFKFS